MASSPPEQQHTSSTPTLRTTMPRHHGHHLRASADLSAFHSPLAGRGNRPNSEIFLSQTPKKNNNAESEQLDEWERELQHYEATLEEMATASLDMKEELGAVEQWFRVLTEAERTAALYSLLQQATQVQIRFFLTVLQQMASKTPVNHLLSPASFEKDAMQQKLNSAMSQLSFDNTPRRTNSNPPPVSPSPRNSRHLDPSTIQAMFPDAAAALAHQRSLLTSNRNSINGGLPTTTLSNNPPRSPALQAAKDAWPITSSTETPVATKIRPRSADLTSWQTSTPTVSQSIKSPRVQPQNVGTPSISEDLASPFGIPGGGSWASMVNTPVVPMFQNPHTTSARGDTDLGSATAMKLAAWNANNRSSVSGGVINLDSDVRKFRRGRTAQTHQQDTLSTPTQVQTRGGGSPTNIVMFDEHGQLMQFTPQQLRQQQQLPGRQTSPRSTSPYPPGFPQQYAALSPVGVMGGHQPYLNPYDTSPIIPPQEFQGYLSDQGDRRGTSPGFSSRKYATPGGARRSSSTNKQEDPLDPNLLNDIPAWLRSLRLHKYTENLQDVKGGVLGLAQLNDQDLERRGVSAVGARRKLLKCFEQVKSGLQADTAEI